MLLTHDRATLSNRLDEAGGVGPPGTAALRIDRRRGDGSRFLSGERSPRSLDLGSQEGLSRLAWVANAIERAEENQ